MKYQRVLYAQELNNELKKRLRITRYNKRKSRKGNVYYVAFSSETDAEYASKLAKRIPNISIKPFQPKNAAVSAHETNDPSQTKSTAQPFPSLPSTLTYMPNWLTLPSSFKPAPVQRSEETLEKRGQRLLGLNSEIQIPKSTSTNSSQYNIRLIERRVSATAAVKRGLNETIQNCLVADNRARRSINEITLFNELGHQRDIKLQRVFQLHSTSYYLKAAFSSQLKMILNTDVRLSWNDVVTAVDALKAGIAYEQSILKQTEQITDVKAKIDFEASIALSAKLIHQLTKLST